MARVSRTTDQERPLQKAPKQRLGTSLEMAKTLLANPSGLKKLLVMGPDEPRYVRPPLEYELPEYRQGMTYCRSNEKYLRPTPYCNPREPIVIAMANELGAYELSDWEFAEAAFWFAKSKFSVEFLPLCPVSETLKRGTGMCMHINSVWLALCRAAGIKARYKSFSMILPGQIMSQAQHYGEAGGIGVNLFNRGFPEMEGEVCIDRKWEVGHVSMGPEVCANNYLPIPRFGEDAIGLTLLLAPGGKIKRFEGLSRTLGVEMKVSMPLVKGAMERVSITALEGKERGRKIIEEAGGLEAYDRMARDRLRQTGFTFAAQPDEAIVFGAG